MSLKILNGEHFIVSADAEAMKTTLFFYYPSKDAIVIRSYFVTLDRIARIRRKLYRSMRH